VPLAFSVAPFASASSAQRHRSANACGFEDGVWLEPQVRAEVTFSELVKGRLRDPVFRALVPRRAGSVVLALTGSRGSA
jgi:hypothetical protein